MTSRLLISHIGAALDQALGLIYPNICQLCLEEPATADVGFVGPSCERQVRRIRSPFCSRCGLPYSGDFSGSFSCANCQGIHFHFASARAAVQTSGPVLEALHRYKYEQALWFEPFLVQLLLASALPELGNMSFDGIVPVPLHSVRQRERTFNQAERLGAPLARSLGISLRTDLVQRLKPTATQTHLSRVARHANVRHAFSPAPNAPPALAGSRWIVFDDVFTTGATTNAVAGVLRDMGAEQIIVWTLARGT